MGGYTVTPEASPTVQLADQMVSVATSSIVPTDWHASKRYFSVLGTGVDEEGDPAVIVAIKDVPRHSTGASIVTVVENDVESETLRRKKRAREFAEKQGRLAITGLPVNSTEQPEAAQDSNEDSDRGVQTATERGSPSRGSTVNMARATTSASGTSWSPTTSDDEAHPEVVS